MSLLLTLAACCDCGALGSYPRACELQAQPVEGNLTPATPEAAGGWRLTFPDAVAGHLRARVSLANYAYTSVRVALHLGGEQETDEVLRGAAGDDPDTGGLSGPEVEVEGEADEVEWRLTLEGEGDVTAIVNAFVVGEPCEAVEAGTVEAW
ncbi:MAG: hypothetical protein ACOZNI_28490 [Myxococcota bacterium]